ncbi:bifunctional metallophosphatase/5'-nucleotidase [Actinocatenispora rupis]|uniref:Bifunctional metallophosphatase/5'-nucleotidase n=1 Tax=Actinocatenispora rupis TaxID=519421 RepID=A0A8J3NA70_9ACTN|nr:bifunctional metallophosphatase/5'-nucleotidase [Actinocatenispora rupis]GID09232.1 bifunctional metallophosphatase/5'-nucleotidase [Actinocatenispora rupis]
MTVLSRRALLGGAGAMAAATAIGTPAYASDAARDTTGREYVEVQLLDITDFHGNNRTPTSAADGWIPAGPNGESINVGGAAYLATHLARLRAPRNSIFFSAGDNFCGSQPLDNKMLSDESTVEVLNALGLQFSALGNHEFDYGVDYLLDHMIDGRPVGVPGRDSDFVDSTGRRFRGLAFPYYSANILWRSTGKPVLAPYNVEWAVGADGRRYPIGFIHLTLTGTPTGSSSYNPDLTSIDEAEAANRYAKVLKDKGIRAIVVVVHDGAQQNDNWHAPINGSDMSTGPALQLAATIDPDVCAIVTGHWHWWFNAMLPDPAGNPRPVVEASHAGQMINEILLRLDPDTGAPLRDLTVSTNHAVTLDVDPDPRIARIVDYWTARGKERYDTVAGHLTADITPTLSSTGESSMGELGADLLYWSANRHRDGHADFAIAAAKPITGSNAFAGTLSYAKGTTSAADADGVILYGEAYAQLGYENPILSVTLTGQQIHDALEQQWQTQANGTVKYGPLNFSANVRATFDVRRPVGDRVDPAAFLIDGVPLDPARSYRVAGLGYTLIGADGYKALSGFTDPYRNGRDHEEFIAYLRSRPSIGPSPLDRVTILR